mmetsp:Transcript_28819/g.44800  ORF Transcript_28819/g.44800 Transcript_28819/m.44800 type:complete len:355 (-) Transcript_28819:119-1183(-)|eukprot:CAMPEP_0196815394 /NCGR_PEP_ID=MMETSP1362-20130617/49489_1 /TAXON_ID=163516 /ORGANISM="Leptocylindrus danicus, Strain CCMP1856" /LENGTH=354 /DNA_ID=CAMNT_0042192325 /DNA_START=147 /DNA_END=1211 /DNA_ORIENTATION=-
MIFDRRRASRRSQNLDPFEQDRQSSRNRDEGADETSLPSENFSDDLSGTSTIRTTDTLFRAERPATVTKRRSFFSRSRDKQSSRSSLFGNPTGAAATTADEGRQSFSRRGFSGSSRRSSQCTTEDDQSEIASIRKPGLSRRLSFSSDRYQRTDTFGISSDQHRNSKDITLIRRSSVVLKPSPNIDRSSVSSSTNSPGSSMNKDVSSGYNEDCVRKTQNNKGADSGCDKEYVRRIQEGLRGPRPGLSIATNTARSTGMVSPDAPMFPNVRRETSDKSDTDNSTSIERQCIIDIYRKGKYIADDIIRRHIVPDNFQVKENVVSRARNLLSKTDWMDHSEITEDDLKFTKKGTKSVY